LREERRLRVFESAVLRGIFGPKRDEVRGEWRKLHNEELHDLYSSSTIVRVIKSRRMKWAGHVACMGEGRDVYRVLVGNLRIGIFDSWRRRWEDNIKADLQEEGCGGMEWIEVAKFRDRWRALGNAVMNHRIP
jgi:3-oxoacyl-ACP reductase-like protein